MRPGADGRQRRAMIEVDANNAVYFSMDEDQGP